MASNSPFKIPARISSLMSPTYRELIETTQRRVVSTASSQISIESTASDFLAAKIQSLENEEEYMKQVKAGLQDAHMKNALNSLELQKEINLLLPRFRANAETLKVLKRQQRTITDDIDDALEKRQRITGPLDEGLLERAYRDAILPRVMAASGKQTAQPFNKARFKTAVNTFYGIHSRDQSWCHILGININSQAAVAAHLVPKSLSKEELAHLFGDEDVVTTLPQNALSLHRNIEKLLDTGKIAVVPAPGSLTSLTSWKCIVLDEEILTHIVYEIAEQGKVTKRYTGKDLDGRVLTFLNDNRPRRRYLYFRFIVSYLWLQRQKQQDSDKQEAETDNRGIHLEAKKFWPSGGEYLHRSTLCTLASGVLGCELPSELVDNQTFVESKDSTNDERAGIILAADIIDLEP
ncbi:hypothetical protein N7528_004527, partial [Penicillium herquei]